MDRFAILVPGAFSLAVLVAGVATAAPQAVTPSVNPAITRPAVRAEPPRVAQLGPQRQRVVRQRRVRQTEDQRCDRLKRLFQRRASNRRLTAADRVRLRQRGCRTASLR